MAFRVFRKTWIVDPDQYKVLAIIVAYVIIALLLAGFLVFLPSILQLMSEQVAPKQQQAASEMLLLHERFWPAIIIAVVLIALHSVYILHRIFGPLYRFRAIFSGVAQGDLATLVKIRKYDFLKNDEKAIRQMVTSLNTQVSLLQSSHKELHDTLLTLKEMTEQSEELSRVDLLKQMNELERQCIEFNKNLQYFRT